MSGARGGAGIDILVDGRTFYLTRAVPEVTLKLFRGERLPRKSRSPRRRTAASAASASLARPSTTLLAGAAAAAAGVSGGLGVGRT